jgi:hypothetical protein
VGTSFEATFKTPRVPGVHAHKYKDCRMVKLYDAQNSIEVAVVVDERPKSNWLAGGSVDAMITCHSQMVHVVCISDEEKVKVHIDPISSENIRFLEDLLSSATIRVTSSQGKKLVAVDLSRYRPADAPDEGFY